MVKTAILFEVKVVPPQCGIRPLRCSTKLLGTICRLVGSESVGVVGIHGLGYWTLLKANMDPDIGRLNKNGFPVQTAAF